MDQKEIERRQKISEAAKKRVAEKKQQEELLKKFQATYDLDKDEATGLIKLTLQDSQYDAYVNHTAAKIRQMQREGETGQLKDWMEFAHEIVKGDSNLAGLVINRKNGVSGKPLCVQPYNDTEEAKAQSVFVEQVISEIEDLERVTYHLLDATFVGLSVAENIWYYDEDTNSYRIKKIVCLPGKKFGFDKDLEPIVQDYGLQNKDVYGKRLCDFDNKFIVHTPNVITTYPNIDGLLRIACWPAFFKKQGLKYWAKGAEGFAFPSIYANVPENTNISVVQALQAQLQQFSNFGYGVVKGATEVKTITNGAAGGDQVWNAFCGYMDKQMSKLINGGTLLTEVGSVGSYASTEVHERTRDDILLWDAKRLASTLKRDLVKPILEMNAHLFGGKVVCPDVYFDGIEKFPEITDLHIKAGVVRNNELRRQMMQPLLPSELGDLFIPGDKVDMNSVILKLREAGVTIK